MDAVTYPLPTPETPEDLERNLQVISRDLNVSREQIEADVARFAKGQPLPAIYTKGDRGYLHTLVALNLGFGSEAELWGEKCRVAGQNLTHFVEVGALTHQQLISFVQRASQFWSKQDGFKNTFAGSPLESTMHFLAGALWTAYDVGEDSGILSTVPMVCQLIEAGKATPADLVQLIYDAILIGIESEEAAGEA